MEQNDLEQASTLIGKHMMENIYWPFVVATIEAMEEGNGKYGYKNYLHRTDKLDYAREKLHHAIVHLNDALKNFNRIDFGHAAADIMIAMELVDLACCSSNENK